MLWLCHAPPARAQIRPALPPTPPPGPWAPAVLCVSFWASGKTLLLGVTAQPGPGLCAREASTWTGRPGLRLL